MQRTKQLVFISLSLILTVDAGRPYRVHIDSVKVELLANDTVEVKVDLHENPRGEQIIDMEYSIKKELPTVYMRAVAKISNRVSEFVFINKTLDVCRFFEQTTSSVIMKLIYDDMTKRGLNMTSCPIAVGSYKSSGFHVNDNKFPPIVPQGRIHMKVEQFTGPSDQDLIPLAIIEISGSIKNNLARAFGLKG